ncbi:hypothetical protein ACHAQH_008901 [Verticillium albo-atrum]
MRVTTSLILALSAQAIAQPVVNGIRARADDPKPTWAVVNVDGSNGNGGCDDCESATVTITKEPRPTTVTHRVTDTVVHVSSKPVISVVPVEGKPDKPPVTVTIYEPTTSSSSIATTSTSTSTSSAATSSSSTETTSSTTIPPVAPVPQPEPTPSPSAGPPSDGSTSKPVPEPESTTYTVTSSVAQAPQPEPSAPAPAPPVWAPEPELPSSSASAWVPELEPTSSLPAIVDPVPAPAPTVSAPPVWVPEPSLLSSSIEVSSALSSADHSWPSEPVWTASSAVPSESATSAEPTVWAPAPTTLVTLISSITEAATPESTTHIADNGLWHTAKYPPHNNGTESHFQK